MDTSGIGRRIVYWRERRGFTQTDFGQLMGQTKHRVQAIEGQNGSRIRAAYPWENALACIRRQVGA
ncbi:hypothetical protein OQI_16170 [Streptomyces pharetrae CZA14]|uniref:Transcriptional regulator n=1 Tax=Streptomyces pharetrae CZA14 TaxID=1144883 RepID=A0ABX3YI76_9ACTN|nr:hypothetical protein OQI_16170 [Streptomyces pharetrae CZA14]